MYSPWVILYKQIDALFKEDPEVEVELDYETMQVRLYVNNGKKADALTKIMPTSKKFGSNEVKILIIPANETEDYKAKYFTDAFEGNGAFHYLDTIDTPFVSNPISYCVFKKEVVQYKNDDIGDAHGICSTLYQDLAEQIFGPVDGVFFCTDVE